MSRLRNLALFLGALLLPAAVPATTVSGKYIVTLKNTADATSHMSWVSAVHRRSLGARSGGSSGVGKTFSIDKFNAYSGEFDAAMLAEIRNNPDVSMPHPPHFNRTAPAPFPSSKLVLRDMVAR